MISHEIFPAFVEFSVEAIDIWQGGSLGTQLSEQRSIQVAGQWNPLEYCFAQNCSEKGEERLSKLAIKLIVWPDFVHDLLCIAESEDACRLVEYFFDGQVHPLPE